MLLPGEAETAGLFHQQEKSTTKSSDVDTKNMVGKKDILKPGAHVGQRCRFQIGQELTQEGECRRSDWSGHQQRLPERCA